MLNYNEKVNKKRKAWISNGNAAARPCTVAVVDQKAKKMKLKKDLQKVAKVDEINQLQANEKLYHSNFFHLQIDELLKETKLPEKRANFINTWLCELVDFLLALPSEGEKKLAAAELKWLKKKNHVIPPISKVIPFDDGSSFHFQFITPSSVFFVGSLRIATTINADPVLDVCIEMPAECFQKGNHLNGVYHRKRALYLSHIAAKLSHWDRVSECNFTYVNGDPLQAALLLKPDGKYQKHINFRVRAVCGEESFKIERFSPDKSNVKQLCSGASGKNDDLIKNVEHSATPHYNSSIVGDLNTKFNDEFVCNTLGDNSHVKDAIVLLKIWLRQRDYCFGYGGFSGYIISMFVVYLIQKERINLSMSSYQIVRQVWIYLASTSWDELGKSISLYESKFRTTQPKPEIFHKYYDVVFIDPTGYYNICSHVSLDVYRRVRHESTIALQLLNSEQSSSFRHLFATKTPIYLQVDHIVRLKSNAVDQILKKSSNSDDFFDYCGYWYPQIAKLVFTVLRRGLDKRVHAIISLTNNVRNYNSWSIQQENSKQNEKEFKFGLVLNSEFALDILDKGPQSNLPEAEEYRKFWGSKSELRRFQDGSIAEACVWGSLTSSLVEKRLVCKQIVGHLLSHHFGLTVEQINYTADELDTAFAVDKTYEQFMEGKNNAENLAIPVIKTFDDLAKNLRSLDELPLVITSVLGKSSVFRYCELLPIIPNARIFPKDGKESFNAHIINEGVIQFESSGKWPNELAAIERVKAAFYLQIGRALRKKFHLRTKVNVDSVDVIKDGFMFRYKIAVPREMALHKKETTSKGVTKYRDTVESLKMERDLVLLPKLTVSLHTLYHQHTSFGPTVLLAKRWLYSQLLDPFLWADVCTELLVAHQYHRNKITEPPTQPQSAFIRFLHTLASTNWKTELILLNFNEDLSKEYIEKLETNFIADRDSFPPLSIVTSNGESNKHTIWSKRVPTVEILARVTLLARHAIKLIEQSIFGDFVAEPLFNASLDGYDLVINLQKTHLRDALLHNYSPQHGFCKQKRPFIPVADYHPVESYLNELRSSYDHVAVFFYNPCGGDHITVLWRPFSFTKQKFKLSGAMGQHATSDSQLEFNHKQIQSDFLVLGHGLVKSITDNRSDKN